MVFASFVFLFWFLPLFLPVHAALPPRWRNLWITLGSFVFYGWWRPHYVLLMVATIGVDWLLALGMGPPGTARPRRLLLLLSIVSNLGVLAWFKYANLFVATWNASTPWPVAWEEVLLPVGISFFTFQSMSYTIDVYRGEVPPERSFPDLLCFVSMFPQLVAGPIVRYRDVAAELHRRSVGLVMATDGVFLFAIGFVKKVLIADRVAPLVAAGFGGSAPGFADAWLGSLGYAVQIYFDFSGYSDMAIGLGLLLGFRFPPNFVSPYRAHSITEFWRRWHVSLSTWLRDYLYLPLGGNRHGEARTYANLALVMLLGGLWHGASWTFLLWGAWQGFFLIVERRLGKTSPYGRLPHALQVAITFVVVTFGWVIFKAADTGQLWATWRGMVGANGLGGAPALGAAGPFAYTALAVGLAVAFGSPRSEDLVRRFHPLVMLGAFLLFLVAVAQLLATDFVPFLYFQF
ncbi:MAG: MBOAT family protein [Planctomycetes bacterium]|nr:MBOAT family protein [Planctomycetota bacterium]